MRILVVSNLYPPVVHGGYEVECAGAVELLRNRGDDVHVLTTRADGVTDDDPFVARDLHFVPETRRAELSATLPTLFDRRAARAHLRRFRPDLAFVWNGSEIPRATIFEILSSGTPTAFRVCQQWFGGLFARDPFIGYLTPGGSGRRKAWSAVVRSINKLPGFRLGRSIEANVAISWVSDFLRGSVPVPDGLRPTLERVIHPTTQHASAFRAVQRRQANDRVVAFAGRLSPEKGADVAIAALGILAREGYDARVVLAGSGSAEDRARLKRAAEDAKVLERCTFAGRLDVEALCALLGRASVLVVPSVWEEPLPITVIEASLARVPIVASRIGGIPEALADGQEALLTIPGDATDLARGVKDVLERPDEAQRRSERAYTRAEASSWESYSAATEAFVDDALRSLTP